jgi:hypothetical protein
MLKENFNKIIRSPFAWLIVGLVVLRIIFLCLYLHDIPNLGVDRSTWRCCAGGDEGGYFNSARSIINWRFSPSDSTLGYPIILAPFIFITGAVQLEDIFKFVSVFHSVIIYSITAILVYCLAKIYLEKKIKAVIVAGIFTVYPYFGYAAFCLLSDKIPFLHDFITSRFAQLNYFLALSDPLSTLLMLGSLLLFLHVIKNKTVWPFIFLGLIASWAAITRLQNGIILPFYGILILIFNKFRNAVYFAVGALPLLFLQLYANYQANSSVFANVYSTTPVSQFDVPSFSLFYPLKLIAYIMEYQPIFFIPLIILSALMIFGFYLLIRKNKFSGYVLLGYASAVLLSIIFYEPTFRNPRYFLPIMPIFFIILYASLEKLILIMFNKNHE